MRDVKHIAFTTDFSKNARVALPAAAALARHFDASLHLLHVLPSPSLSIRRFLGHALPSESILREGCEAKLQELAASEIASGLRTETHVLQGSASDEVARFVTDHGIGLVALSTHGQSGLQRFLLGSTTEKIIRSVSCSVMVVRDTPTSWQRIGKVLFPTDLSEAADSALGEVAELAQSWGAELILGHALEEVFPTQHVLKGHGLLDVNEQMRKGVQSHLENLQKGIEASSVRTSLALVEGVPSAALADLARDRGVDLIVVPMHRRTGLGRFTLGSTVERVVRIAPCSVLILKERGK